MDAPSTQPRPPAVVLPFPRPETLTARVAELVPPWRSVVAGLAAVALAAGVYAAARVTPAFAIRTVAVEGASPELAREVRAALAPLRGTSLLALDAAAVHEHVRSVPGVRFLAYDRAFPHTLVIAVVRERPTAVLRHGADSWLVSAHGRLLEAVPRGALARLPRVWMPSSLPAEEGMLVADVEALLAIRVLAAAARERFPARIRTVTFVGSEVVLVLASRLEVRLGSARDLVLKLAVAGRIVRGLPRSPAGPTTYVDVSVPARPVAGSDPQV